MNLYIGLNIPAQFFDTNTGLFFLPANSPKSELPSVEKTNQPFKIIFHQAKASLPGKGHHSHYSVSKSHTLYIFSNSALPSITTKEIKDKKWRLDTLQIFYYWNHEMGVYVF